MAVSQQRQASCSIFAELSLHFIQAGSSARGWDEWVCVCVRGCRSRHDGVQVLGLAVSVHAPPYRTFSGRRSQAMPFRRLFCARWSLHQPSNNHLGGMPACAKQQSSSSETSHVPVLCVLLAGRPTVCYSLMVQCSLPRVWCAANCRLSFSHNQRDDAPP